MMAIIVENKCVGKDKDAIEGIDALFHYMFEREVYIQQYFEFYIFAFQWDYLSDDMRQALGVELDNMNI